MNAENYATIKALMEKREPMAAKLEKLNFTVSRIDLISEKHTQSIVLDGEVFKECMKDIENTLIKYLKTQIQQIDFELEPL